MSPGKTLDFQEMFFAYPQALLLIALLPLMAIVVNALFFYRRDNVQKLATPEILSQIIYKRSGAIFWTKSAAAMLAWVMLALAMAQPKGNAHYPPVSDAAHQEKKVSVQRQAHDVILFIDASASMGIADIPGNKTRFEAAKEIADQIAGRLGGNSFSLYAFTSAPAQISPGTYDTFFVRMMIQQMEINEGGIPGTNVLAVLEDIHKKALTLPSKIDKTVVILSDGGDTQLEGLQGSAYQELLKKMLDLVSEAKNHQMQVLTIGVGSEQAGRVPGVTYEGQPVRSALNSALLEKIAQAGNGWYSDAQTTSAFLLAKDLEQRVQRGDVAEEEKEFSVKQPILIYDSYYQYPLGIAILLIGFILLFPDTTVRRNFLILFFCMTRCLCEASETSTLNNYNDVGDYHSAIQLLNGLPVETLPDWQQKAVVYDLGTLYLSQGKWTAALDEYRKVRKSAGGIFLERLNQNSAVAYWREAMHALPLHSLSDYQQFILDLRHMLEYAADPALLRAAKMTLADALKEKEKIWETYGSFKENVLNLLVGVERLIEQVDFLAEAHMNDTQRQQYMNLYSPQQKSWLPLWTAMGSGEMAAIAEIYRQGVDAFEKGLFKESRNYFLKSRQALSVLLKKIWGEEILPDIVGPVLSEYTLALTGDTPSEADFQLIFEKLAPLASVLPSIKESVSFLEKGISSLKNHDTGMAIVYILYSKQMLNTLFKKKALQNPKDFLALLIENQSNAVEIGNRIWDLGVKPSADLAYDAQKIPLALSKQFLSYLVEWQGRQYHQHGKCQCAPWDKVIPLFEKGKNAAEEAVRSKTIPESLQLAKEALTAWQKALDAMNPPKPPSAQEKQPPPPQEKKTEKNLEEVLRHLQQMQQDDKRPPKPMKHVEGIKPW